MREQKILPLMLLAILIGGALIKLGTVLLPFGLAAAIAYFLNPLVAYFEMRGIRRRRAVMVVYLTLVCLFVTLSFLGISAAIQSASNFGVELPLYAKQARLFVAHQSDLLQQLPWVSHWQIGTWLQQQIGQGTHTWLIAALQKMPSLLSLQVLPLLEMSLLVPLLVFFFMLDGQAFLEQLLDFVPARYVEMTLNILVEINYSLGNYLRGIMLQACFMGFFTGVGFWLMGLHYAVYIAVWVALTSVIPYLGPISVALAGGIVALFQWGTLGGMLKVLVIYGVIRLLDDWFLQPLILRRAVDIHPLFLVFTVMAGASLGGFWGLLFAVPTACMVKVLLQVGWQWYRTEYGSSTENLTPTAAHIPLV